MPRNPCMYLERKGGWQHRFSSQIQLLSYLPAFVTLCMISLTANAATHLLGLLAEKQADASTGLRVQVDKGGCAGWQYIMRLDTPVAEDRVFTDRGVSLIIDNESLEWLQDSQIDYLDALNDSGFRVLNPNAERSCGCGTSFEPKPRP